MKRKRSKTVFCDDDGNKVKFFQLTSDSASMNFAACLKPEFNGGLELEGEQQAYVFQNSIIITFM